MGLKANAFWLRKRRGCWTRRETKDKEFPPPGVKLWKLKEGLMGRSRFSLRPHIPFLSCFWESWSASTATSIATAGKIVHLRRAGTGHYSCLERPSCGRVALEPNGGPVSKRLGFPAPPFSLMDHSTRLDWKGAWLRLPPAPLSPVC